MTAEHVTRLSFELFVDTTLDLVLFRDVTNSAELHRMMLSNSLQCALINPALVPSVKVIQLAATRAIASFKAGAMLTRNPHTELLLHLSASRNIKDSLRRFGMQVGPKSDVLLAVFSCSEQTIDDVRALIKAERECRVTNEELWSSFDVARARTTFKASAAEVALETTEQAGFEAAVCTRIAVSE